MHFEDLSHESYIGKCPHLRSVGWLSAGHDFHIGEAPPDLVPLLESHLQDHWHVFACAGSHECEFCLEKGIRHSDSRNLFIPGSEDQGVFLVPGMIVHYIGKHRYCPPSVFMQAVRNCPPQGSDAFMQLMKEFCVWWEAEMEALEARQSAASPHQS